MPSAFVALPSLPDTVLVDADTISRFQETGHALIGSILSEDEVVAYRQVIKDAASRLNTENRKLEDRDTYGKAFLQIMNLWEADEGVKKFTLARRFGKIAAELMGVKNVRIYHDQALFKEPCGGPTPWHEDQY